MPVCELAEHFNISTRFGDPVHTQSGRRAFEEVGEGGDAGQIVGESGRQAKKGGRGRQAEQVESVRGVSISKS
jgi:hypothetical protein